MWLIYCSISVGLLGSGGFGRGSGMIPFSSARVRSHIVGAWFPYSHVGVLIWSAVSGA